ncbi:C2 domain-containing protein [Aureococcus anophagefferens]|nr:C2 domain-containing protein [Aureococcus anophagefferens]
MRRNTGRARAAELRFYRHAVEETHAAIDDAAAAADDGGDASSLHVVVEVQRARGLAAVDKKGHAHPFCAITLVEATTGKALPKPHHKASRTRVVKGTTAPSWETTPERFAFDGVPVGAAGPPKLRVDVLSYTSVLSAPKPLGRASVSLAGLGPAAAALWLRLEPFGSLKAATGEVLIKVSTRHSHAVGDVPEEVLDAEAARWFVDEEVVADPLHHHPPNCLRVAVVRGRGLRAMDGKGVASSLLGTGRGGSSDPYVTVGTKRFVAKTKVKAKTLDPVWMEAFELEYDAGDAWLRLRVDDSDVAGHEFMGSGLVKLSELPRNHDDDGSATAFWVTLIDGDCGHDELEYDSFRLRARDREKDLGEIKVAVKLCYDRRRDPSEDRPFFDEAPDPAAAGRWPNELRVAVCRAEGLREGDAAVFRSGSGSSDPYVRLSLEGDFCELLQRTKTAMKTTHPVFNEIFAFELDGDAVCRRARGAPFALKLEVFDWDWIGDDDFLGQCRLPLPDLVDYALHDARAAPRAWVDLTEADGATAARGRLQVAVQCRFNPDRAFEPFRGDAGLRHRPPNELRLGVFKRGSSAPLEDHPHWREVLEPAPLDPPPAYDHGAPTAAAIPYRLEVVLRRGADGVVGTGFFDVGALGAAVPRAPAHPAVTCFDASCVAAATVYVAVAWTHNPGLYYTPFLREPPCDEEPNVLCVALVQARDLAVKDRGLLKSAAHAANKLHLAHFAESSADGSADPRAVFKVRSRVDGAVAVAWRSSTAPKTLHPVWHEQWKLRLDRSDIAAPVLSLELEDVDAYTKNDFMGRVDVDLSPLLDREVHRGWHKLLSTRAGDSDNVRGAVELVLKWCRDDRAPPPPPPPAPEPEPAPAPEPEPGVGLFGAGLVAAAAARAHHHHHEPEPEAGMGLFGAGLAAAAAARHHHDVVSEFLQAPVEVARTPRDDDDDDSDDDDDDEDEEVLATLQEWEALEVFVEPPRRRAARPRTRSTRRGGAGAARRRRTAPGRCGACASRRTARPAPGCSTGGTRPRRPRPRRGDGREEEATGRAPAVAEGRLSLRRVHLCDVCVCGGDGFAGRKWVVRVTPATVRRVSAANPESIVSLRVSLDGEAAAWAFRRDVLRRRSALPPGKLPRRADRDERAAEFCAACGSGDLDRARALLDAVAVDARDANGAGETALTRAVRLAVVAGGRRDARATPLDILDLLMDRGADPYARSYEGQSAVDVLTTMADLHTGVPAEAFDAVRAIIGRAALGYHEGGIQFLTARDADKVRAYQKHERALVEAKRIEERLRDAGMAHAVEPENDEPAPAAPDDVAHVGELKLWTKQSFGTAAIYAAENDTEDTGQVELTTRAKQRLADPLRMHGDPRSDPRNFMHDARRAPAAPTGDDAADFILGLFGGDVTMDAKYGPAAPAETVETRAHDLALELEITPSSKADRAAAAKEVASARVDAARARPRRARGGGARRGRKARGGQVRQAAAGLGVRRAAEATKAPGGRPASAGAAKPTAPRAASFVGMSLAAGRPLDWGSSSREAARVCGRWEAARIRGRRPARVRAAARPRAWLRRRGGAGARENDAR